MSEQEAEQPEREPVPETGLPAVDEALARLGELDGRPVGEHHDPLAAAHEALHDALSAPSEPAATDAPR